MYEYQLPTISWLSAKPIVFCKSLYRAGRSIEATRRWWTTAEVMSTSEPIEEACCLSLAMIWCKIPIGSICKEELASTCLTFRSSSSRSSHNFETCFLGFAMVALTPTNEIGLRSVCPNVFLHRFRILEMWAP